MQWWNDFVDWFTSSAARPTLFSAAVLVVAIIVAGVLAALIARSAVKGMLSRMERQQRASAVAALVDAATEASVWSSLTPQEQILSDRAVGQADIMVRMLPVAGAGIAANWASHQLAELKRSSAAHGPELDPAVSEFRDRLIEWQFRPSRARRIFQEDLERWRYDGTDIPGLDLDRRPAATSDGPPPNGNTAAAAETTALPTTAPPHRSPSTPAAGRSGPDTQTQRLMDDVDALGKRPASAPTGSEPTGPTPAFVAAKPTGSDN